MELSPKNLILDLLSTVRRTAVPVGALVEAAQLFGFAENALRVALARLLRQGLVERDERGRYALGQGAEAVQSQVSRWYAPQERMQPWSGGWLGVHTSGLGRSDRKALRKRERALAWLGFHELSPGLAIRPDNLAGGVKAVREQLHALGLEAEAPIFELAQLDSATESRAQALWDREQLLRNYVAMQRELEASATQLSTLPKPEARVESFLVGGRAIRMLARDPLLPEPIVPSAARHALVSATRKYNRLGRRIWSGWLKEETSFTPVNLGMLDAAEAWAVAQTGDSQ